jgi:predicted nucleic-acid-binding Zn-ribbon protein
MRQGHCPKCSSTQVVHGLSADGEGLSAGSYPALIEVMSGSARTTLWLDTYLCCDCGYVEMYVANQAELGAMAQAEGWEK